MDIGKIIIVILILLIVYSIFFRKTNESFDSNLSSSNSILNLSNVSDTLANGGITIPGNIKVLGNINSNLSVVFTANGDFLLNGNITQDIVASGFLKAQKGITTDSLFTANLLTANAGILSGRLITANAGILSGGLITANAGILSKGSLTGTDGTFSGLLSADRGSFTSGFFTASDGLFGGKFTANAGITSKGNVLIDNGTLKLFINENKTTTSSTADSNPFAQFGTYQTSTWGTNKVGDNNVRLEIGESGNYGSYLKYRGGTMNNRQANVGSFSLINGNDFTMLKSDFNGITMMENVLIDESGLLTTTGDIFLNGNSSVWIGSDSSDAATQKLRLHNNNGDSYIDVNGGTNNNIFFRGGTTNRTIKHVLSMGSEGKMTINGSSLTDRNLQVNGSIGATSNVCIGNTCYNDGSRTWYDGEVIQIKIYNLSYASSANSYSSSSSFTPKSNNSILAIEAHGSFYPEGYNTDGYYSELKVNNVRVNAKHILYKTLSINDSFIDAMVRDRTSGWGGSELLPITGYYKNSDTANKTISFSINKIGAVGTDDKFKFGWSDGINFLKVTEIYGSNSQATVTIS